MVNHTLQRLFNVYLLCQINDACAENGKLQKHALFKKVAEN